ncbi:MAG: hypothetical protein A2X64_02365 [Ignavibacteria bacterium GWF2_33_9]|nr:MAG: hypothetical protein A2X64_02365 [Ignavibacteria bacterium GWF2_33_9]
MKRYLQIIVNDWKLRLIIYLIILFTSIFIITSLSSIYSLLADNLGGFFVYFSAITNFVIILLPIFIIEKIRKVSFFKSIGLNYTKRTLYEIIKSFLYILIPFLIIFTFLYFTVKVEFIDSILLLPIFSQLILLLIFASQEEILFRGFILNTFSLRFSEKTSLILSAILFSSIHSINYNFSMLAAFNTFLGGIFFGTLFLKTKSLWMPIFTHYFWNLIQSLFLNSKLSGSETDLMLFKIDIDNKIIEFLINSNYGFEGTFVCSIVLIALILIISKIETLIPENSSYIEKIKINSNSNLISNVHTEKKYKNK